MQQYKQLLQTILDKGTWKEAARSNMPRTLSLFGYQFRHNLQNGFPLLTTKTVNFKAIVVELLWFLRGDTNIKYLVDNGVNIWNEDAYNYYVKTQKDVTYRGKPIHIDFKSFIDIIKDPEFDIEFPKIAGRYRLGDCGYQYGKVWRNWEGFHIEKIQGYTREIRVFKPHIIDQIANLIKGLKENPESRRHIVTAIDPAHDSELALYWCHSMFQFNCRKLTDEQRINLLPDEVCINSNFDHVMEVYNIPKYYLDCHLYQRSADVFLGVPYNIASYALLTHIIAKICNMIPVDFIHSFGDVHIYENHIDAVNEQLTREPKELPEVKYSWTNEGFQLVDFEIVIEALKPNDFSLENYNPHPPIKAKLSTGLIK